MLLSKLLLNISDKIHKIFLFRWSVEWKTAEIVPPAQPIAYSQIPFYLTGLTDTPAIVGMIKVIVAFFKIKF